MALKLNEIETVEDLEEMLDGRYVLKNDCQKKQDEHYKKIEQIQLDTAKIGAKLNLIAIILGAIGTSIIAAVVKIIFGG